MQPNLTQLQYQQLQIQQQQQQQQQQQRLAQMMQQKQQRFGPSHQPQPSWEDQQQAHQLKQQQQLFQMQQQQRMLEQQQQQSRMISQQQPQLNPPHPSMNVPPPVQQPIIPILSNPNRPPTPNTKVIQAETETQKKTLQLYEYRDDAYQSVLHVQHKRHVELAQTKKQSIEMTSLEKRARIQGGPIVAFGPGYRGYFGNSKTGTKSKVRYPQDNSSKKRKRGVGGYDFKFPVEALNEQAQKEDTLVPIRIDLEHEGYKLRDTFTWNLNESLITPEQFAEIMCQDLKLPQNIFKDQISKVIKEQIDDYNLNASSIMNKEQVEETLEQKSEALNTLERKGQEETEKGIKKEDFTELLNSSDKKGIELRTIIKLDITVENRELVDQFEWDISCPRNSPEEFANKLVTELGLGGEFKTAIAHSIREQIHVYIKSLLLVGYEFTTSSSIADDEIRHSFLPHLKSIIRQHNIERFTPSITELTDAAIEKMEKERMREARRKRRGARARRGIILPDREAQKTHRTALLLLPEPTVQELTEEQQLYLQQQGGLPADVGNKRSAALKARMNIAAEAANDGSEFDAVGVSLNSNKYNMHQQGGGIMNNSRHHNSNWQNIKASQYHHNHHH